MAITDIPNTVKQPTSISNFANVVSNTDNTNLPGGSNTVNYTNPNPSNLIEYTTNDLIWIELKAVPIFKLSNDTRTQKAYSDYKDTSPSNAQSAITLGGKTYYFTFLSQSDLTESLSHSWEPYDSLATKITDLFASYNSTQTQLRNLNDKYQKDTFTGAIRDLTTGVLGTTAKAIRTKSLNPFIEAAGRSSKSGYVLNQRVDTPLQYKGSNRRTYDFTFTLINTDDGGNFENVVKPVKVLEALSCPLYDNDTNILTKNANIGIILPYMFSINTKPRTEILSIDMAVLTSVSPTWKGPWVDGYPTQCELRLGFTEYRPLERSRIGIGTNSNGNIITAQDSNEINRLQGNYVSLSKKLNPTL